MGRLYFLLVTLILTVSPPAQAQDKVFTGDARVNGKRRIDVDLDDHLKATFAAEGDGNGDIDCYLYEGGIKVGYTKLIDSDDSTQDGCRFEVTPSKPGPYFLIILNLGDRRDHYTVTIKQ